MVTPAATCWPGWTVTVATRPLVAKSRLAVEVGWIVPVAPMVWRTVPSWAATVRYCVPPERVSSHAVRPPATIATTRMIATTLRRLTLTRARRRRSSRAKAPDRTNDTSATPISNGPVSHGHAAIPATKAHGPSWQHAKLG